MKFYKKVLQKLGYPTLYNHIRKFEKGYFDPRRKRFLKLQRQIAKMKDKLHFYKSNLNTDYLLDEIKQGFWDSPKSYEEKKAQFQQSIRELEKSIASTSQQYRKEVGTYDHIVSAVTKRLQREPDAEFIALLSTQQKPVAEKESSSSPSSPEFPEL